jgi:hypothetical protein
VSRAGEKDDRSIALAPVVTRSRTISAVMGASRIPFLKCPVARVSPAIDVGPRSGRRSVVVGRKLAQVSRSGARASEGTRPRAMPRMRCSPPAVTERS